MYLLDIIFCILIFACMLYIYTENIILCIIDYVHAYYMHLLLIPCQGQEGTSLLILGLNAAWGHMV